jgi:predicted nucleotidyltransferase
MYTAVEHQLKSFKNKAIIKLMKAKIQIDPEEIAEFCRKNHIRKLAFFGSVIREDFSPESDVDVLVEFEPGVPVGLIRMAGMELELSKILGRKADLRTPEDLSPYFRKEVMESSEVQYAEG